MVEKVWVGKKVQVLSLEELEKKHFKDEDGNFWYSENKYCKYGEDTTYRLRYENRMNDKMQKLCGKVCEVNLIRVRFTHREYFRLKEDSASFCWHLWMVKEPISIEKVLESE